MKKDAGKSHSLRIVGLFCLAVAILIGVSIFFKIGILVSKSIFDGQHRFTFIQKGNPVRVYSFAPDIKTISILDVAGDNTSSDHLTKDLIKIPIDASLSSGGIVGSFAKGSVQDYLKYLFFHYSDIKTEMTPVDIFRLWLFASGVDTSNITSEKISLSDISESNKLDKLVTQLFSDATLQKENMSIQVINGTGISGWGSDFGQRLTNSGGNVISIITAHIDVPKTSIRYFGQHSYTLKKIEKIMKREAMPMQKHGISDIVITLGKDEIKK